MTAYAWPSAWVPRRFRLMVVPNERMFTGYYSGQTQSLDLLGEKWECEMEIPESTDDATGAAREAFFDRLQGRANSITLTNIKRPIPRGTLRGAPTFAVTAAQLAATVTLGNCTGNNLYAVGSSFETDSNSDGIADGWTAYSSGTTGTITNSLSSTAFDGAKSQQISSNGLGTTNADRIGVKRDLNVSSYVGRTMFASVWAQGSPPGNCDNALRLDWLDSGGALISTAELVDQPMTAGWTRLATAGHVVPVGTVTARLYLWADQRSGSAGAATVRFDGAQLELDQLTDYARATLLAGDTIGFNGQMSRCMADTAAADDGTMVVEVLPRTRAVVSSGTSVVWNAPTVNMLVKQGGVPIDWSPGNISGAVMLQLVEA